jgi:chitodextrinase
LLYAGSALTFTQTLTSKTTWSYRLCAKDKAGNMSAGSTKSATTPQ